MRQQRWNTDPEQREKEEEEGRQRWVRARSRKNEQIEGISDQSLCVVSGLEFVWFHSRVCAVQTRVLVVSDQSLCGLDESLCGLDQSLCGPDQMRPMLVPFCSTQRQSLFQAPPLRQHRHHRPPPQHMPSHFRCTAMRNHGQHRGFKSYRCLEVLRGVFPIVKRGSETDEHGTPWVLWVTVAGSAATCNRVQDGRRGRRRRRRRQW